MKRCPKCGEYKPEEQYYKDYARLDETFHCCKQCDAARTKRWQQDQREQINQRKLARVKQRRRSFIPWAREWFDSHPCVECGSTKDLTFHKTSKGKTINILLSHGYLVETIKAVAMAVGVVCIPCLRKTDQTSKQRPFLR